MKIKELPKAEWPKEKLEKYGPERGTYTDTSTIKPIALPPFLYLGFLALLNFAYKT